VRKSSAANRRRPERFPSPISWLAFRPRSRVIVIANPTIPPAWQLTRGLLKIAEAAPDAAVVIDEAYFEFCGAALTWQDNDPDCGAPSDYR